MAIQRIENIDSSGSSFDLRSLFGGAKYVAVRSSESVFAVASAQSGKTPLTADQTALSSSGLSETDEGLYKYTLASTTNFIVGQIVKVTTSADALVDYFVVVEKTATTLTLQYANIYTQNGTPASGDKIIALASWDTSKSTFPIKSATQSFLSLITASGSAEVIMVAGDDKKEVLDALGATGTASGTSCAPVPVEVTASGTSITVAEDAIPELDVTLSHSVGIIVDCTAGTSIDVKVFGKIGTKEVNITDLYSRTPGATSITVPNGDPAYFGATPSNNYPVQSIRVEVTPSSTESYELAATVEMRA